MTDGATSERALAVIPSVLAVILGVVVVQTSLLAGRVAVRLSRAPVSVREGYAHGGVGLPQKV